MWYNRFITEKGKTMLIVQIICFIVGLTLMVSGMINFCRGCKWFHKLVFVIKHIKLF